ncbi:endolytic transglycosylase MltG [Microbacterium sp. MC2]
MPSTPSNDDQFADLFSRLPTPADRSSRTATDPSAAAAAGADRDRAAQAPMSRRAAREAAARAAASDRSETPEPVASARAADYPVVTAAMAAGRDAPSSPEEPHPVAAAGSLDALFDDAGHHGQQKHHDRDRRKSRIAAWSVFGVVLALLGGLVFGGFWVWSIYEQPIREFFGWTEPKDYEAGIAEGEATVTIASGDTGGTISETLHDAGVTKTPGVFYDYLIASGADTNLLVPGVFSLQQKMTAAAAFEALTDPANKLENTAQLREGLTVEQTLPLLAEATGIAQADFEAAIADPSAFGVSADSLEGWLFPATYTFEPDVTADQVIQTLVDRAVTSLDNAGVPVDRRHEILTIASIIQREARFSDDFFKVSRVIQNRLKPDNTETHGLLQMDSTAQYGANEDDGTVSSDASTLEDDNPWNTYLYPGLPLGPIANPGDLAIEAAMEPADGPWMYFVTVNPSSGETEFAQTHAEHEQLVEKWRQWCADNPDNGDC